MVKFGASAAEIKSHTGCIVSPEDNVVNARTGEVLAKAQRPAAAEAKGLLTAPENTPASQPTPAKPQITSEITPESYMQMMQAALAPAQSGTVSNNTYTSKLSPGAAIGEMTLDEYTQTVQAAFAGNGTGCGNDVLLEVGNISASEKTVSHKYGGNNC